MARPFEYVKTHDTTIRAALDKLGDKYEHLTLRRLGRDKHPRPFEGLYSLSGEEYAVCNENRVLEVVEDDRQLLGLILSTTDPITKNVIGKWVLHPTTGIPDLSYDKLPARLVIYLLTSETHRQLLVQAVRDRFMPLSANDRRSVLASHQTVAREYITNVAATMND